MSERKPVAGWKRVSVVHHRYELPDIIGTHVSVHERANNGVLEYFWRIAAHGHDEESGYRDTVADAMLTAEDALVARALDTLAKLGKLS